MVPNLSLTTPTIPSLVNSQTWVVAFALPIVLSFLFDFFSLNVRRKKEDAKHRLTGKCRNSSLLMTDAKITEC